MNPELTQIMDAIRNVESDLEDLRDERRRLDEREQKLGIRKLCLLEARNALKYPNK